MKKYLSSVLVLLIAAIPLWSSAKSLPITNQQLPQTAPTLTVSKSSPQNENWQYMGKVKAVTDIRYTSNYKDYHEDYEYIFLYSTFDGEDMHYKVHDPQTGQTYDVHKSSSYCGAKIKWSPSGNRVEHIPSLSQMYTHWAGPYHFNVGNVQK